MNWWEFAIATFFVAFFSGLVVGYLIVKYL